MSTITIDGCQYKICAYCYTQVPIIDWDSHSCDVDEDDSAYDPYGEDE